MAKTTKIEYADSTVNPMMGCTGCELYDPDPAKNHCYAATLCNRYAGCKGWPQRFNEPEHFPGRLEKAIGWSDLTGTARPDKPWLDGMPRVVFVNDMSDGFCHGADPDVWLLPYLNAMGQSPHIWLLLTKWAKHMRGFIEDHPLPPNVWPGVSVLRQMDDHRIATLCQIQAAVRWVSLEPLLGSTSLNPGLFRREMCYVCGGMGEGVGDSDCPACEGTGYVDRLPLLAWVVAGGESGPNARPTHPDWARKPRDDCQAAGVPFLWKQWGRFLHVSQMLPGVHYTEGQKPTGDHFVKCSSKYAAGRLLDGREWNEIPTMKGEA